VPPEVLDFPSSLNFLASFTRDNHDSDLTGAIYVSFARTTSTSVLPLRESESYQEKGYCTVRPAKSAAAPFRRESTLVPAPVWPSGRQSPATGPGFLARKRLSLAHVFVVNVGLLALLGDDEGDPSLRKDVWVEASLHREAHTEQAESA